MIQPDRHKLAEFNMARLIAPQSDPRIADFTQAVDRINGLAERMPGFVWRLEGDLEYLLDAKGLLLPNMSVWEDVEALETFVWNTLHRKFYERRAEWFEVLGKMHFAMWWVPEDHVPTVGEALARLEHLETHGDSDHAFGWSYLEEARLWKTHQCSPVAAE